MVWFWAAVGSLAALVVVLAWLSDRAAVRKGIRVSSADIARNLRESKRERRRRLMVLRRTWVPGDDGPDGRPGPTNRPFRG